MTGDDFQRRNLASQKLCSAVRAILMIYAMKAVTPDAAFVPFVRAWIDLSFERQIVVKSRVEYCDLQRLRKQFLNQFDALQPGLIVKRSDR